MGPHLVGPHEEPHPVGAEGHPQPLPALDRHDVRRGRARRGAARRARLDHPAQPVEPRLAQGPAALAPRRLGPGARAQDRERRRQGEAARAREALGRPVLRGAAAHPVLPHLLPAHRHARPRAAVALAVADGARARLRRDHRPPLAGHVPRAGRGDGPLARLDDLPDEPRVHDGAAAAGVRLPDGLDGAGGARRARAVPRGRPAQADRARRRARPARRALVLGLPRDLHEDARGARAHQEAGVVRADVRARRGGAHLRGLPQVGDGDDRARPDGRRPVGAAQRGARDAHGAAGADPARRRGDRPRRRLARQRRRAAVRPHGRAAAQRVGRDEGRAARRAADRPHRRAARGVPHRARHRRG